jgi:hypothetical protein
LITESLVQASLDQIAETLPAEPDAKLLLENLILIGNDQIKLRLQQLGWVCCLVEIVQGNVCGEVWHHVISVDLLLETV